MHGWLMNNCVSMSLQRDVSLIFVPIIISPVSPSRRLAIFFSFRYVLPFGSTGWRRRGILGYNVGEPISSAHHRF